jgi:hypothetical protein
MVTVWYLQGFSLPVLSAIQAIGRPRPCTVMVATLHKSHDRYGLALSERDLAFR